MNIKIEGDGIYLEITVDHRNGSVDERMLELVGSEWRLSKAREAYSGQFVAQGRKSLPDVIARALKIMEVT